MRLLAVSAIVIVAAGVAISIEASPRKAGVSAADCRGTTGQPTTLLRDGLRRSKRPLFRLRRLARGLSQPVYVATTPAEPTRLYVVEKRGRVWILQRGHILNAPFLDLRSSVRTRGEEGLLSIAFHPRYATTHLVYAAFDDRRGDVNLVEYRTSGGRVVPSAARRIFLVDKLEGVTWHNGGQLQFGPDGKLYFSTGDSAHTPLDDEPSRITDPNSQAQDLSTPFGKLLRIDVDAATPSVATIAYGLRNPWRFSFDRATGAIYLGDVGFHLREEIDVIKKPGSALVNFGWSACEGREPFLDLDADPPDRQPRRLLGAGTVLPPLITYAHPRTGYCTARGTVIGGYVYRGRGIPKLRGRYVFGDWCSGEIWSAAVAGGRTRDLRLERVAAQVTGFGSGPGGELYATTLGGSLYRLDP
jgi:glucose/arabinose dehydrogenase